MFRRPDVLRRWLRAACVAVGPCLLAPAAGANEEIPDATVVEVFLEQARALAADGSVAQADLVLVKASDAARALGDSALEARILRARFDTLDRLGERLALRTAAERLLAVETSSGDDARADRAEVELGAVLTRLGEHRAAETHLRRAESGAAGRNDSANLARARAAFAALRDAEGRTTEALALWDGAVREFRAAGDRNGLRRALLAQGALHAELDSRDRAAESVQEAIRLLGDDALPQERAAAYRELAVAQYLAGDLAAAHASVLRCVEMDEEAGDDAGSCADLQRLGRIDARRGDAEAARRSFEKALGKAGDDMRLAAGAARGAAEAETRLGRAEDALRRLAQEQTRTATSMGLLAGVLRTRAAACLALRPADVVGALQSTRAAWDALDLFAEGLYATDPSSLDPSEDLRELAQLGIRTALKKGDPEPFLELVERARNATLLDGLGGRAALRGVGLPAGLAQAEQDAYEAALDARARLMALPRRGDADPERRTAVAEVATARRGHAEAVARIRREARRASELAYPVPPRLAALKAGLWDGEALVLYAMLPEETAALVVTRKTARIVRLGPTPALVATVRAAIDREHDGEGVTSAALAAAAAALLGPLELPADVRRIIVVPRGVLSLVPFPALLAATGADDRVVTLTPSAGAYLALGEDRTRRGERVLALGDPAYRAPVASAAERAVLRGTLCAPLPGTRAEVEEVASGPTDVRLLGDRATESGLREAAAESKRWRAVHLAVHAILDPSHAGRCLVALAPAADDDGLLLATDLVRAVVPADVVVLTGCRVPFDVPEDGAGIPCFARAFLCAGASRLVVSLWDVDDEAARVWTSAFHAAFRAGVPASVALRDAQAKVRADPRWAHPRFWAGWVIWGLAD